MATFYYDDYQQRTEVSIDVELEFSVDEIYEQLSDSERHDMADFLSESGYFEGEDTRYRSAPPQPPRVPVDIELQVEQILESDLKALPDELIDGLREKLSIPKPTQISANDSVISEIKLLFSSYEKEVTTKTPMLNELNLLIANI